MTAKILIDALISHYSLNNMSELSVKLQISQSVISNWKSRNAIGAIVEKINEIDENALESIFTKSTQTVINNSGQVAKTVEGNQNFNNEPKKIDDDKIDSATYNLFQEAYNKAIDDDDLKGLRVYLMDY